jgi:Protein of unknown function (DUF2985)
VIAIPAADTSASSVSFYVLTGHAVTGWIYVGERQPYIINIIDNVLVALFALNGDVLAPFRARDTYHMIFIAHYHHLTWQLRKKKALPKLQNENDLPAKTTQDVDVETAIDDKQEISVLAPKQQEKLRYHQTNSQSRIHSTNLMKQLLTRPSRCASLLQLWFCWISIPASKSH